MHKEKTQEDGVVQVEAPTLFEGVKRVASLGIGKLIIECDNLRVINMLKQKLKTTLGDSKDHGGN